MRSKLREGLKRSDRFRGQSSFKGSAWYLFEDAGLIVLF